MASSIQPIEIRIGCFSFSSFILLLSSSFLNELKLSQNTKMAKQNVKWSIATSVALVFYLFQQYIERSQFMFCFQICVDYVELVERNKNEQTIEWEEGTKMAKPDISSYICYYFAIK